MRLIATIVTLIIIITSCSEDDPQLLLQVDLDDAIAIYYKVSADNQYRWHKIRHDGTTSELKFQWEPKGVNSNFIITPVKDYLIATSQTLKETYFIERSTGKAYKSGHYFDLPYMDVNSCSDNACYYYSDNSFFIIKDYLSGSPDVKSFPSSDAFKIMEDIDGMITFTNTYSYLHKFEAGVSTLLMEDFEMCSWRGEDGHRKLVDENGDLYRITKDGNVYLHTYDEFHWLSMVTKFPSRVLGIGIEPNQNQYVLQDMNVASKPTIVPVPDLAQAHSSFFSYSENYLHIFVIAGQKITLIRINANTLENSIVEYTRSNEELGFVAAAIADDFVVFRDGNQLMRANADGTTSVVANERVNAVLRLR